MRPILNQWTLNLVLKHLVNLLISMEMVEIDALTDGLLTLRYLFGLQGDTLINGVLQSDATRTTAEEIEAHLETLMPAL